MPDTPRRPQSFYVEYTTGSQGSRIKGMMRVMREVRFALVGPEAVSPRITNSWAGWPGTAMLAPHLALRALIAGPVDPVTGYLVNIALIDRVLRESAIPIVQRARSGRSTEGPAGLMEPLWSATSARLQGFALEELELRTTPFLRYAVTGGEPHMVSMTQSFEFAAAHRLYVPELSEEENRRVFGKCMNANGHGHNYVVEVTIAGSPEADTGTLTDLPAFEAAVKERVIDRFDHKHLNADCPEFARLNPTVENITRVIWDLLEDAIGRDRLRAVRVWETPKTYAEFRGPAAV
jgi:6-pyruvoyltetrahydropterin/6-carboxytetrahydropterin synthase